MPPELHPYAFGFCVALGAFLVAWMLADLAMWLLRPSKTEEDKNAG